MSLKLCGSSQRFMLPVYSALHFIPMLVLRRKHFAKDPLGLLMKATVGTIRSCSFLGVYVMIYQGEPSGNGSQCKTDTLCCSGMLCARQQTLNRAFGKVPLWIKLLLKRKETFWAMGFAVCASLVVEEPKRRAELGMFGAWYTLSQIWG